MVGNSDDEFTQGLKMCLAEKRVPLCGKRIPVMLGVEEIELIERALAGIEAEPLREALAEALSELESCGLESCRKRPFQEKIDKAHSEINGRQRMLELLRTRFSEAIDDELERQRAQSNLGC